jgi:hypothetical protein
VSYRLAAGHHWHCAVVGATEPQFTLWLVLQIDGALAIDRAVTYSLAPQVTTLLANP